MASPLASLRRVRTSLHHVGPLRKYPRPVTEMRPTSTVKVDRYGFRNCPCGRRACVQPLRAIRVEMMRAMTLLACLCLFSAAGCGGSSHASSGSHGTQTEIVLGGPDETSPSATTAPVPSAHRAKRSAMATRPRIVRRYIPFGAKRKLEMAAYAERHYGINSYRLQHPHAIVEHYTVTPDFQSTYNTFAADVPDTELHEPPGTCSHFVVDRDGTIYQLVSLGIMCRHTVGLNYTAIGIEHVGMSDSDVMNDHAQLAASLKLTRWLRCRYGIAVRNVIGHAESLSSPYHHENVPSLRTQTHADMQPPAMDRYRRLLRQAGGCG